MKLIKHNYHHLENVSDVIFLFLEILFKPPSCWFSYNNSETVKAAILAFCRILCRNIFLEKFVPNLLSLTCPSLKILGKTQTGAFPISRFMVNLTLKKIFITPKLDKRNKTTSKNFDNDVISKNCDVIIMFSLIVTFYLTKTENRTKNL